MRKNNAIDSIAASARPYWARGLFYSKTIHHPMSLVKSKQRVADLGKHEFFTPATTHAPTTVRELARFAADINTAPYDGNF